MAEVQFAKSFLSTLDRKPIKLSSDYVSDPKKYPSQAPYVLLKPSHQFPASDADVPGNSSLLKVTLKPTKASFPAITLADTNSSQTTILDLKTAYATQTSLSTGPSAVKILFNKRPLAGDVKTLNEVLPTPFDAAEVEFGVMIIGSAVPSAPAEQATGSAPLSEQAAEKAPAASGQASQSTDSVMADGPAGTVLDDLFWSDLQAFLVQRTKSETEGARLTEVFRKAAA